MKAHLKVELAGERPTGSLVIRSALVDLKSVPHGQLGKVRRQLRDRLLAWAKRRGVTRPLVKHSYIII